MAVGIRTGEAPVASNKTRMWVTAASPYRLPKSVDANGNFGHFCSSQQHASGACDWYNMTYYVTAGIRGTAVQL